MKKLITICLVLIFCATTSYGVPRSSGRDERGAFTGPRSGTAQDDNIKASLDLLHANQAKYISKVATSASDDLFDVDGGPIMILDFIGVVTTNMSPGNALDQQIQLDADSGGEDYGFSTSVAVTNLSVGNRIVFTAANPSVLTPLSGTPTGATSLFKSWICQEGMIEQQASPTASANTGAITWIMIYMPLADDVTVTAQ
jgi:hypothetical protein